MNSLDRIALLFVILGALNWGSWGLFRYDVVATLFGGATSAVSRLVYIIIGLSGLYAISLLFRERETVTTR